MVDWCSQLQSSLQRLAQRDDSGRTTVDWGREEWTPYHNGVKSYYLHLLAPTDRFFLLHSREGSYDPPGTVAFQQPDPYCPYLSQQHSPYWPLQAQEVVAKWCHHCPPEHLQSALHQSLQVGVWTTTVRVSVSRPSTRCEYDSLSNYLLTD